MLNHHLVCIKPLPYRQTSITLLLQHCIALSWQRWLSYPFAPICLKPTQAALHVVEPLLFPHLPICQKYFPAKERGILAIWVLQCVISSVAHFHRQGIAHGALDIEHLTCWLDQIVITDFTQATYYPQQHKGFGISTHLQTKSIVADIAFAKDIQKLGHTLLELIVGQPLPALQLAKTHALFNKNPTPRQMKLDLLQCWPQSLALKTIESLQRLPKAFQQLLSAMYVSNHNKRWTASQIIQFLPHVVLNQDQPLLYIRQRLGAMTYQQFQRLPKHMPGFSQ